MKFFKKVIFPIVFIAAIAAVAVSIREPLQQYWKKLQSSVTGIQLIADAVTGNSFEDAKKAAEQSEELSEGSLIGDLSYYGYNLLSDSEKLVYRQFLAGVLEMKTEFEVATNQQEVVDKVYNAILADRPDLFWLGGYTVISYMWGEDVTSLEVEPEYLFTKEEKDTRQQNIEEASNIIINEAKALYNEEYGRVLYIYEKLIRMTNYNLDAPDNQNICSVFLNHSSVCMGYAKSFHYLAQKLGLECVTIAGYTKDDTHAWNLIRMEGQYYYVDPTWGDMNYSDPSANGEINYLYFGMTAKDLAIFHKADMDMELPETVSENCNYYVREGLMFDGFSKDVIGALIREKSDAGAKEVSFRFRQQEAYEEALKHLFEDGNVFDYCANKTDITYIEYKEFYGLTIYL